VFVMMEHLTKSGESKFVRECTYPLTGVGVVSRVYTDLATIDIGPGGLQVVDRVDGLSLEELAHLTGLPIQQA
jgi:3-oxoadipate CoA-transferase beta subunit